MAALFGGSWWVDILAGMMISCFDRFVYWLATISFDIFRIVSRINIFTMSEKATEVYNTFSARVYMIIGIVAVFYLSYQLLLMIIEPEGAVGKNDGRKVTSSFVKNLAISIFMIIIMPLVFRYMALFQNHVIDENTMFNIVLGQEGMVSDNPGRDIAVIVYTSFFHPYGTDLTTFTQYLTPSVLEKAREAGTSMLKDGDVLSATNSAIEECKAIVMNDESYDVQGVWDNLTEFFAGSGHQAEIVCENYTLGLLMWYASDDNSPKYLMANSDLTQYVNESMDYFWIIATVCGGALIFFFISYAFDLGTRAIKLAFLQLIAPIPIMLRVFPSTANSFEKWTKQLLKTYCDIFIRCLVIAFVVQLCVLLPDIIGAIFDTVASFAGDNILETVIYRVIAIVAILYGLLMFAKEAPDLIKSLFATGDLFSGLNLKPQSAKKKLESNEYAMRGLSAGSNIYGRARATKNAYKNQPGNRNNGWAGMLRNLPRDIVRGARDGGGANYAKTLGELRNQKISGAGAGAADAQNTINHGMLTRAMNVGGAILDNTGDSSTIKDAAREAYQQYRADRALIPSVRARAARRAELDKAYNQIAVDPQLLTQSKAATKAFSNMTEPFSTQRDEAKEEWDKYISQFHDISQDVREHNGKRLEYIDNEVVTVAAEQNVDATMSMENRIRLAESELRSKPENSNLTAAQISEQAKVLAQNSRAQAIATERARISSNERELADVIKNEALRTVAGSRADSNGLEARNAVMSVKIDGKDVAVRSVDELKNAKKNAIAAAQAKKASSDAQLAVANAKLMNTQLAELQDLIALDKSGSLKKTMDGVFKDLQSKGMNIDAAKLDNIIKDGMAGKPIPTDKKELEAYQKDLTEAIRALTDAKTKLTSTAGIMTKIQEAGNDSKKD